MPGDPNATRLTIDVDAGRDALPEDVDALTRRLRSEIQDFGVEDVTLQTTTTAPAGTKSVEAVTRRRAGDHAPAPSAPPPHRVSAGLVPPRQGPHGEDQGQRRRSLG